MERADTIAAIATAPGQGGIGIVRVSGPAALKIAMRVSGIEPRPRRVEVCAFRDADGRLIDKGVMLYFRQPASYTGEEVIELQGHGGPVVLSMLLRQVIRYGARQANPGEFTERAFLNDKLDLAQAEAVATLISSRSAQAARNAVSTLEGVFSGLVEALSKKLIEARVYVESLLDFPEEEAAVWSDAELKRRVEDCREAVAALLRQSKNGRLYAQGLHLAIVGRPNSGKSTLLNRLCGSDRAIVSAQPGTTRDTLEADVLMEDIPFRLIDTAGIRADADAIEAEGIARALAAARQADVILLVIDHSVKAAEDASLPARLEGDGKLLRVFNKIDLLGIPPRSDQEGVRVSARTGAGLDLLRQAIVAAVSEEEETDTRFAAQQRHVTILERLEDQLRSGRRRFEESGALELLAADLRETHQELGRIRGDSCGDWAADDLLGEIFSRFCIGK